MQISGGYMEEKITVTMTPVFLYDFLLYHTYSKLSGFLTNVLGMAVGFMGIIMLIMGRIQPYQLIFYLVAAVIFVAYTPLLIRHRAKKQVEQIERYRQPGTVTFSPEEGITFAYADKEEKYAWDSLIRVVTTPKTMGFYYGENDALIIPKQDFKDRFVPIMTMVTQHMKPGSVRFH